MSVGVPPVNLPPVLPPFPVRRFTVDEYHRMIRASVLPAGDRVELLEGWIVPKMTRNPPHDVVLDLAQDSLRPRLPAGWRLRVQSAVTTADSEPEPDLAVVPGPASRYWGRHPGPRDVSLVIEVADTSLDHDRQDKGRLYGRAAIACYWVINVPDRQVEVYTDPTGPTADPGYRRRQDYDIHAAVPFILEGQERGPVPVREFFP